MLPESSVGRQVEALTCTQQNASHSCVVLNYVNISFPESVGRVSVFDCDWSGEMSVRFTQATTCMIVHNKLDWGCRM